jgi:hypothetical protein
MCLGTFIQRRIPPRRLTLSNLARDAPRKHSNMDGPERLACGIVSLTKRCIMWVLERSGGVQ